MKIAIANQKGGVGKTTTAINLSDSLTRKGRKVLLIDTDPQCNSTDTCKAVINGMATLADLLFTDNTDVRECIQHTDICDIIASDKALVQAEQRLPNDLNRFILLKDRLKDIEKDYDYVIIDTSPKIDVLLYSVLIYADKVIIPVTCDSYSFQGVADLFKTIIDAKRFNNSLEIFGIVFTKYNDRRILSKEYGGEVEDYFAENRIPVFTTKISESESVKKSQVSKESILEYDKNSKAAMDYDSFAEEVMKGALA